MRDLTQERLEELENRLVELLKESINPKQEMAQISEMLLDEDLSDFQAGPKTSIQEFAATIITDNPKVYEQIPFLRHVPRLSAIETPEELILSLMIRESL